MVRTLLLFLLICVSGVASTVIVDDLNIDRALGDLLEAIFGSLSEEDGTSLIALVALSSSWCAFGVAWAIPSWRRRLEISISRWPFRQSPARSYLTRTGGAVFLGLLMILLATNLDTSGIIDEAIAIPFIFIVIFIYIGMIIHDFHGIMLSTKERDAATLVVKAKATSGWILPDSITQEMLGKPELRYELAKDLRTRAANMRRFSLIALAGIGALLVVAVNVILFAGFIANLGVGQTGAERIQALLDSETLALTRVEADIAYNSEAVAKFVPDRQRQEERTTRKKLNDEDLLAVAEDAKRSVEYRQLLVEASHLVRLRDADSFAIETILAERTEYLKEAIDSDFGTADQANNFNLLIASGITRFGILFIMLFIAQILVNLYRYTMRMSAYYLSQADALLLAEDGGESLLRVVPVFSPQDVDFGKAPATPAQSLEKTIELAAKLR